ncbi:hypothetical protein RKD24_004001 [Streptomyces calvus]
MSSQVRGLWTYVSGLVAAVRARGSGLRHRPVSGAQGPVSGETRGVYAVASGFYVVPRAGRDDVRVKARAGWRGSGAGPPGRGARWRGQMTPWASIASATRSKPAMFAPVT